MSTNGGIGDLGSLGSLGGLPGGLPGVPTGLGGMPSSSSSQPRRGTKRTDTTASISATCDAGNQATRAVGKRGDPGDPNLSKRRGYVGERIDDAAAHVAEAAQPGAHGGHVGSIATAAPMTTSAPRRRGGGRPRRDSTKTGKTAKPQKKKPVQPRSARTHYFYRGAARAGMMSKNPIVTKAGDIDKLMSQAWENMSASEKQVS